MNNIKKYFTLNLWVTVVFIVFAYWILAVKNGFMLRWYDEMSLFEPTRFFFHQFLYYPGGLLRYAGAWLTQLMYYPWLGTTIFIILWLLLAFLTCKAFRLSASSFPFALIVPLALVVSIVQIDEAWLSMKTTGYMYANTLGFIFTSGAVLLFRQCSSRIALSIAVSILIAVWYCIAGYFALLAGLICGIIAIKDAISKKKYANYATAATAIISIIVVPPMYYTYLHGNTVDNDYLYLKGLPELMMESYDKYLWMPFIVATAVYIILSLLSDTKMLKERAILKWISIASVCCVMIWSVKAEHKSEQLRATVLMLQNLDDNDWNGMVNVMMRIKEPANYTMLMLNNLAWVNLGNEGKDLSAYSPQKSDARHSERFSMTAFVQVPVFYNIGRFNESYRWAMEHTVQYGKRAFFLKYMVRDALMKGDIPLAKRYNDILLSTMFHRKWAENMNRYIENPSLIESAPEFQHILAIKQTQN